MRVNIMELFSMKATFIAWARLEVKARKVKERDLKQTLAVS
jgi:hypothetical protein